MPAEFILEDLVFKAGGPVNLVCEAASCTGISGASGTGKTLLLRAIADLDPHTGEARLHGVRCADLDGPQWRRRVAYLPADAAWWSARVGDHFSQADESALQQLNFGPDVLDWPVERLSSGEKQRLALLRMLANTPEVLLLDEPTANLDTKNRERVEKLLATYRQARSAILLWVSHDQAQLARVTDRVLCMADGQLT